MIKKEINIYSFGELSKEVQKEVINNFRSKGVFFDDTFLKDEMEIVLQEELKKENIEELETSKIFYSLSYCQGDGALFTGRFNWNGWTVKIEHRGHYYHERSTNIDMVKDTDDGEVYASIEELEHFEEKVYIPICLKLKKVGYGLIDDMDDESYIAENIEANNYQFRENGQIENL